MNQVILVGRLVDDPIISISENNKKYTAINLAVSRNFKNADGVYETDFIRCVLWNSIAANAGEYCHKGDVVGIKGRLQNRSYEDAEENTKYITEVIAERVTYLSSNNTIKDEEIKNS